MSIHNPIRGAMVALALLAAVSVASRVEAADFTVVTTDDNGEGSLRWAIEQANTTPGTDTISFAIPGEGVQTISLVSPLPAITEPVTIDGLSQPGASCAIWPPTLLVELNGNGAGAGANGLLVTGGGSVISGLVIHSFGGSGIRLEASGGNVIRCLYVGTDTTGTQDRGNGLHGVYIHGTPNNAIGGDEAGSGNLISGNARAGVYIDSGATGNLVQGNSIGTQANGALALSNGTSGVYIVGSTDNVIGGSTDHAGNIISGNGYFGVHIHGLGTTGNRVLGNHIGTGTTGTEDLGNARSGVYIWEGASDNTVGGPSVTESNLIAHNGYGGGGGHAGVRIGDYGTGNLISRNAIFANDGLGIDLDPSGVTANDPGDPDIGPNSLQNYPVLTSLAIGGSSTTIAGTLNSRPSVTYQVEFFYNACVDQSGYGEGEVFFGSLPVTTDGSGNASFTATFEPIPVGSYVSATATDPENSTSEFSAVYTTPTVVKLLALDAQLVGDSVVVEWTTATEIDSLGFNLYRAAMPGGARTLLNGIPIPSQALGLPTGSAYSWEDGAVSPGGTYDYWLVDIDVHGVTTVHGPVSVTLHSRIPYLPLCIKGSPD